MSIDTSGLQKSFHQLRQEALVKKYPNLRRCDFNAPQGDVMDTVAHNLQALFEERFPTSVINSVFGEVHPGMATVQIKWIGPATSEQVRELADMFHPQKGEPAFTSLFGECANILVRKMSEPTRALPRKTP